MIGVSENVNKFVKNLPKKLNPASKIDIINFFVNFFHYPLKKDTPQPGQTDFISEFTCLPQPR